MQIKEGLNYFPDYLKKPLINDIICNLRNLAKESPFFIPKMPKTNKSFSVKITNMGNVGWVSDKEGYRYQDFHPITKKSWSKIPSNITNIWQELINANTKPDCCLVNCYDKNAKMGLHIDNDEKDFSYPVLSISIGASALFRFGGLKRSDKTQSIKLNNGDIIILSGKSRLIYHGIDKIYPNDKFNYRINITMRKI